MSIWSADFETTTDVKDCRVWAWAVCNVDDTSELRYGIDVETFVAFMRKELGTYYFHNLSFDGEFILSYLMHNGYRHSKDADSMTFDTLISKTGKFYSIVITFEAKDGKKKAVSCALRDSLKKLPMSVKNVAKAFALEESKLTIDYNEKREVGHKLTPTELRYIRNDVVIVAKALQTQFAEGLKRMTVGADALGMFKTYVGNNWNSLFPELNLAIDTDIRRSYKGGYTYVNPVFQNRTLDEPGIVLDVNSLYPHIMYDRPLPVGTPVYFRGEHEPDPEYPLFIQHLTCMCKLRPGKMPTLQVKNNPYYVGTEYITKTDEPIEISLSCVDLALFFEHYDVDVLHYTDGWKFRSQTGFFCGYIDYWNDIKMNAKGGKRTLAKLMLNSLYGKFATNPDVTGKTPVLDSDGVVHYVLGGVEFRKPVYTPVGVFVTAWARDMTIRAAQSVFPRFIYADTDSLHLVGADVPENIDVHPHELGKWKHEGTFTKAKFLRAKTYMEEIDGHVGVTCAGLPESLRGDITFESFTSGLQIFGKLRPHHVKGGIVLEPTTFTVM